RQPRRGHGEGGSAGGARDLSRARSGQGAGSPAFASISLPGPEKLESACRSLGPWFDVGVGPRSRRQSDALPDPAEDRRGAKNVGRSRENVGPAIPTADGRPAEPRKRRRGSEAAFGQLLAGASARGLSPSLSSSAKENEHAIHGHGQGHQAVGGRRPPER